MFRRKYMIMDEAGAMGGGGSAAPAPASPAPASESAGLSEGLGESHSPGQKQQAKPQQQGSSEPKEQKPQAPKFYEVKVNGKTQRFTEEELLSRASMAEAAQQRFNEAAQMRKQAEAVIGKIRDPKNVIAALQDPALGLTKDQIRESFEEWYAKEFIEPEKLSPEQRKLKEMEERLEKYANEEKQREEQKRKEYEESLTAKAREQIQNDIIAALDTGKLAKTNASMRRLAKWISINNQNGYHATPDVLVAQVKREIAQELRDLTQASDGEVLMNLFEGTDLLQKVRKYDLEQLRKTRGGGQAPQQEAPRAEQTSDRPLTSAEVNQRLRELQRTGRY